MIDEMKNEMNEAPEFLNEEGKKAFIELINLEPSLWSVAHSYKAATVALCAAYSDWKTAREYLLEHGQTYDQVSREGNIRPMKSPQIEIEIQKWRDWTGMLKQLGLVPNKEENTKQRLIIEDEILDSDGILDPPSVRN